MEVLAAIRPSFKFKGSIMPSNRVHYKEFCYVQKPLRFYEVSRCSVYFVPAKVDCFDNGAQHEANSFISTDANDLLVDDSAGPRK